MEKLIPVDEFLPVMFDKHTNETWLESYENRNLIALSARPLLLHPTHVISIFFFKSKNFKKLLFSIVHW